MNIRDKLAKKLMYQQSLDVGERWSNNKFRAFKGEISKPTNEYVMVSFFRHITAMTNEQKDFLSDKLFVPVSIQQKWEIIFEEHMSTFWEKVSQNEQSKLESEILSKEEITDEGGMPKVKINIKELLKDIYVTKEEDLLSLDVKGNTKNKVIKEYELVDFYISKVTRFFNKYEDFLIYLKINGYIKESIFNNNKERYFLI